jgi:hypothetical protein
VNVKPNPLDIDWKQFEELVARIEQALAPVGAVVKLNDWIVNNVTGRKRQVDASIRFVIGSVPILITVECRKRKDRQDDMWIEQLATKKLHLGAAKTIAVASEDISPQAKKSAELHAIEVRRLSAISQQDMVDWLKIENVQHIIDHAILEGEIAVEVHPGPRDPQNFAGKLHQSVIHLVQQDAGNAKVINRHVDGAVLSVLDMLEMARGKGRLEDDIPLDGSKVHKTVKVNVPKGLFWILTEHGERDLATLTMGVDFYKSVVTTPVSDLGFEYGGSNTKPIYGVEAMSDLLGKTVRISLIREQGSRMMNVGIEITKGPDVT